MTPRIAYLGPPDSYSHLAAIKLGGTHAELVPMPDFSRTIHAVDADTRAVVPIENSLEGTVNAVTDILIWEVNCFITREISLDIRHRLFALRGVEKKDIRRIVTHPQAYGPSRSYLAGVFPDARIEFADSTAQALAYIDGETAAIAGAHIKRAGIVVLDRMERLLNNTTRFVLLGDKETKSDRADKVSVVFETENKPGALNRILNILSDHNLNMTKIESRPHKSVMGRYLFLVDFAGNVADPRVADALQTVQSACVYYKYLGNYSESV